METIAIYFEPVIKTYGILERTDLVLWSLTLRPALLARLAPSGPAEQAAQDLELVVACPLSDGRIRLHLVLNTASHVPPWVDAIDKACDDRQRVAPVAMVYFQGPHFGDRYGIAEAALTALVRHGIEILVVACAGASLHFVVPRDQAQTARQALSTAFVVPTTHNRSILK
jgi:hypothetical protein